MNEPLQLQFFDSTTRRYVPYEGLQFETLEEARAFAHIPWRLCKADRDLKPVYRRPHSTSSHSIEDVQVRYLTWAVENGIGSVTVFMHDRTVLKAMKRARYHGKTTYVDADEYFAVEESTC
jgi:hypothetical protein